MKLQLTPYNKQIASYIIIGGISFMVEALSFLALHSLLGGSYLNLLIAQSLSFCLGIAVNFPGSRYITFKGQEPYVQSVKKQFARYMSLICFNLVATNVLIYIMVYQASLNEPIAKILTMLAVVLWNFILLKRFIFR